MRTQSIMFELVKNDQLHRLSKTSQEYRNGKSRFIFGRFFKERTIVAKPLADGLTAWKGRNYTFKKHQFK